MTTLRFHFLRHAGSFSISPSNSGARGYCPPRHRPSGGRAQSGTETTGLPPVPRLPRYGCRECKLEDGGVPEGGGGGGLPGVLNLVGGAAGAETEEASPSADSSSNSIPSSFSNKSPKSSKKPEDAADAEAIRPKGRHTTRSRGGRVSTSESKLQQQPADATNAIISLQ